MFKDALIQPQQREHLLSSVPRSSRRPNDNYGEREVQNSAKQGHKHTVVIKEAVCRFRVEIQTQDLNTDNINEVMMPISLP